MNHIFRLLAYDFDLSHALFVVKVRYLTSGSSFPKWYAGVFSVQSWALWNLIFILIQLIIPKAHYHQFILHKEVQHIPVADPNTQTQHHNKTAYQNQRVHCLLRIKLQPHTKHHIDQKGQHRNTQHLHSRIHKKEKWLLTDFMFDILAGGEYDVTLDFYGDREFTQLTFTPLFDDFLALFSRFVLYGAADPRDETLLMHVPHAACAFTHGEQLSSSWWVLVVETNPALFFLWYFNLISDGGGGFGRVADKGRLPQNERLIEPIISILFGLVCPPHRSCEFFTTLLLYHLKFNCSRDGI